MSKICRNFRADLKLHRPVKFLERSFNALEKKKDFVRAVTNLWQRSTDPYPNLRKLCRIAASQPAPQFYISAKRAVEMYFLYKHNKPMKWISPEVNSMYMEIFRRYEELRKLFPNASISEIMRFIVTSEAPCFYLSPSHANIYYYKALRTIKDSKK